MFNPFADIQFVDERGNRWLDFNNRANRTRYARHQTKRMVCSNCRQSFAPSHGSGPRTYCSRLCRDAAVRLRNALPVAIPAGPIDVRLFARHAFKRCPQCGALLLKFPCCFSRNARRADGLQRLCRSCLKKAQPYKPRPPLALRECKRCGTGFVPGHGSQMLCSFSCKKSVNREYYAENREMLLAYASVRNARINAEKAKVTNTLTVNEWRGVLARSTACYWCGLPFTDHRIVVRGGARAEHKKLGPPTMDHRTPMSKGGANSVDNVVASHLWCNSIKQDMLPSEIPEGLFVTGKTLTMTVPRKTAESPAAWWRRTHPHSRVSMSSDRHPH
jgi:HNH endonuclease